MSDTTLAALRQRLIQGYDELKLRLTRRLGSAELAGEALQDTWLRLARMQAVGAVRSPGNYLFRIALNVARDRRAAEDRHLSATEIDGLLELADDAPDPARTAEARASLRELEAVMAELPPRQREILLAARLDGLPRREIANRLGISLRLVEKELQRAQEYCLAHRDRTGG
jgi:RNA polymerase sigma-70 factor (ECF subfamily)